MFTATLIFFCSVFTIQAEEAKTLISASEPDYPPFCIEDEAGNAEGFSVELLEAAAAVMGYEVEFRVAEWSVIKNELAEGKLDVLPLVGRSAEREKIFDFTVPYHKLHGAVFVRKNANKINDFEDLKNSVIIVMKDDNADEFVTSEFSDAEIIRTDTFETAFRLLDAGEGDAVIAQKLMGQELIKSLGLKNISALDLDIALLAQNFCFAVKKGNNELLDDLNEGLVLLYSNGTYERIYRKWFFKTVADMTYLDLLKACFLF